MPSFQFFEDESFHFETLRALCAGADLGEALMTIPKIKTGNFDSWASGWYELACRAEAQAASSNSETTSGQVSARDAYFRAANYYRTADFFLHGNPQDPRVMNFFDKHLTAFDSAIALLANPGRRLEIQTPHGFHVPAIFYASSHPAKRSPKPTLIIGNGYDGTQEEMLYVIGFAALERGYNVLSYEGPGQPTVRRYQGLGFTAEWERVVTPVVDYVFEHAKELNVDTSKLGLWGQSLGGMLGLRAVAFEKRIKAFIGCDGVWDASSIFPPDLRARVDSGEEAEVWQTIKDESAPTGLRWAITHGFWAMFNGDKDRALEAVPPFKELFDAVGRFNVIDTAKLVECKVLVCDAEQDQFFGGQPVKVASALGAKATYHLFKSEDGSGAHCHVGTPGLLAQVTMDWLEKALSE